MFWLIVLVTLRYFLVVQNVPFYVLAESQLYLSPMATPWVNENKKSIFALKGQYINITLSGRVL
ncbi:MAG: hypothetical protein VB102_11535 [Paludibacter sp.]|nr:hypothetical protein [Paludibacter sp.]